MNHFKDGLSRLLTLNDWRINTKAIRLFLDSFPSTIDRFEKKINRVCNRFNSELTSPGSFGINSRSQDWSIDINFWNPSLKLLPPVVIKICHESAKGILLSPYCPASHWFTHLLYMALPQIFDSEEFYLPPLWAPPQMPLPP